MTFKLENIITDIDFRGEQYFVRVLSEFPMQNTRKNIKVLQEQIIQGQRLIELLEKNLKDYENRSIDLGDYSIELTNRTLKNMLERSKQKTNTQESKS